MRTILIALLLLSAQTAKTNQPAKTKDEPKLSKHELAMENVEYAKRGVTAAQAAWDDAVHLYGSGKTSASSYNAHINVARAKADLCEAENDAGLVRCKTTVLERDHSQLIDVLYFHVDGSMRGTHYYFADHRDGTYEDTETAVSSSK
jgi:hypothetical protein